MYQVYFYEAFQEEEEAIRRYLPEKIKAGFTWKTIQESGHNEPPAEIISVRTQSVIPQDWAEFLESILSRSTGYDHLQSYCEQTGSPLACGYLPLYCNRSVAEQALLLWMSLLRKLRLQENQFDIFKRDGLTGREVQYRNLVVVGVGNIGYEIVRIGRGLDMQVTGVDIEEKHEDVRYRPVDTALPNADIVVCAMNLTQENYNYFNYERLKQTPSGALFVNIARGEMSPSLGLLKLIEEKHLGGLALDVYNQESRLANALRQNESGKILDPDLKATLLLREKDNVILTPHNAFNTEESVERKAAQSVDQIIEFMESGTFKWNVPLTG